MPEERSRRLLMEADEEYIVGMPSDLSTQSCFEVASIGGGSAPLMVFIALSSFAQALLYPALGIYLLYKSRAAASVLYADLSPGKYLW